ncbi:ATP-binding protein [Kitasatospora sp. NPDC059327]|uniref:ATP-binding protein n=1 Tax=Kitasatospora sp. NPDC059327 TaxID=3346803 RepID=UPI003698786E
MIRVAKFTATVTLAAVPVFRELLVRSITNLDGFTLDDDRAYALRLCISELLANGVEHVGLGDKAELLVEGDLDKPRGRLRVTVTDGGLTVPEMNGKVEELDATSGRGLAVLGGYADDVGWGQRTDGAGKPVGFSVWFELNVQPLSVEGQATAQVEVRPEVASVRSGRAAPTPARIRATGRRRLARVRDVPRSSKDHLAA